MQGKELKSYLEREGVTQQWLARELGMSQPAISSALQAKDVKTGLLERICAACNWSMGHFYPDYDSPPSKVGRPYYDVDFCGGFDIMENDQTTLPSSYIDVPQYNKDGVVWCNITGHSMEPLITHGEIIALKEVYDFERCIIYGEVYGIVTVNDLRTVKRLRRSDNEGCVLLVPENKDYDEQEIRVKDIRRIYSVLGSVRRF